MDENTYNKEELIKKNLKEEKPLQKKKSGII